MIERIICRGHPNIVASHPTTFEFTKDEEVTKRGDCIIGVAADRGLAELSEKFKEELREGKRLTIRITANGKTETAVAYGSVELPLSHQTEIVIRKSDFISDRTLAINSDKAAKDFSLDFTKGEIVVELEV